MPKSYSLEAQSNGRVQVVQTDKSEDNRSIVIDDLKVFASSESKQQRVLRSVKDDMKCVDVKWNEKKCAVEHVNIECLIQGGKLGD